MRTSVVAVAAILCAAIADVHAATVAPAFRGTSDAVARRIAVALPPGWRIAERAYGDREFPNAFTNRGGGGQRLLLRGRRNVPLRTIVNGVPRTTLAYETIELWILPADFRARLPGVFEALQLALYPSPPNFAASNAQIRVYAYGASSYNSWPTWQNDLLRNLSLRRDKL